LYKFRERQGRGKGTERHILGLILNQEVGRDITWRIGWFLRVMLVK